VCVEVEEENRKGEKERHPFPIHNDNTKPDQATREEKRL
jgi:hypothetical protein